MFGGEKKTKNKNHTTNSDHDKFNCVCFCGCAWVRGSSDWYRLLIELTIQMYKNLAKWNNLQFKISSLFWGRRAKMWMLCERLCSMFWRHIRYINVASFLYTFENFCKSTYKKATNWRKIAQFKINYLELHMKILHLLSKCLLV